MNMLAWDSLNVHTLRIDSQAIKANTNAAFKMRMLCVNLLSSKHRPQNGKNGKNAHYSFGSVWFSCFFFFFFSPT